MNAIATHKALLARKASIALVTFAIVSLAVVPLLPGHDRSHPALNSANASPAIALAMASVEAAEAPRAVYVSHRHLIQRDAAHGNVTTYGRD